nr:polysaccharide deacetylase family protein [bacterium]
RRTAGLMLICAMGCNLCDCTTKEPAQSPPGPMETLPSDVVVPGQTYLPTSTQTPEGGEATPQPTPVSLATAQPTPAATPQMTPAPTARPTAPPMQQTTDTPPSQPTGDFSNLSNKKVGWGSGHGQNGGQPGLGGVKPLFDKYGAYVMGSRDSDEIYFTFDCGYENGYTGKILDTLKAKGVKATFFVTYPYVRDNPELVRRMIDEGHIVGNHSTTHPSFPDISVEKQIQEVMKNHNYVRDNFGYNMSYFRFPMGEYSERTLAVLQSLGYHSVFWSWAYLDYDVNNQRGTEYALGQFTTYAHAGAIYLIHVQSVDNANALGPAIDAIRQKGYAITQLTGRPK